MPLPKPRSGESEDDFIGRCMSDRVVNDEYPDQEQRSAVCFSQYKGKMMNDLLLQAIKNRGRKQTQFAYGLLTADMYVKTMQDAAGLEACYRYLSKGHVSFDDLMKKAARTLTYSNPEMVIEEKRLKPVGIGVDLPKNTLMAFRHVLTTSTKDRDGDILHSEGASVDPKMLLLWQHVHTMPIGKMLAVHGQDKNKLEVISCIVDMNELSHDAAVMVDNDMGRFSHGFRAIEFTETKAGHGGKDAERSGFDITKFEIMEESLVSVPANVGAQCEEVLLSLVEGNKLTSPLMKQIGRGIRDRRNVQVPGVEFRYRERKGDERRELVCRSLDQLKAAADAGLITGVKDENEPGDRAGAGEGRETGASKEADAKADKQNQEVKPEDDEVTCPECGWKGAMPANGKCPECGIELTMKKVDKEKSLWDDFPGSWGEIQRKLQEQAKAYLSVFGFPLSNDDWVSIAAMFDDHVILTAYRMDGKETNYKVSWKMVDGEPKLTDSPKEIELTVETKGIKAEATPDASDEEKPECPKCGSTNIEDGVCQDCGYEFPEESTEIGEEKSVKQGRTLSGANEKKIRDALDDLNEAVSGIAGSTAPRGSVALMRSAIRSLTDVLDSMAKLPEVPEPKRAVSVKEALVVLLTDGTKEQRKHVLNLLKAIEKAEEGERMVKNYRRITVGRGGL